MSALSDIRPLPPLAAPLFDPEGVAIELRQLDRWCVAHCTLQTGGSVKKQLLITGRQPRPSERWKAESNDPATWNTFDAAVADARVRGFAIAMSFGRETDLFFLDVDRAFDADGALLPGVVELIERFNSRTELTVSGRGLRIIGRGQLPERARKLTLDGDCVVELFPRGGPQFALISGRAVAGFEAIRDCSDVLATLAPAPRSSARKRTASTAGDAGPVREPIEPARLTADEEATVVGWAAPLWQPRRRNDLTLGLTGYLLLQGVQPEQALAIIDALTRDDDEREKRLTTARRTIERHQRGEAIAGWSILTEELGLSRERLRPLERIGNAVWRQAHPLVLVRPPVGEPVDLFVGLPDATVGGDAEDEGATPVRSVTPAAEDTSTDEQTPPAQPRERCREDFVAYLPDHKYLFRATGELWPKASVNAVVPPVEIGTHGKGKPVVMLASDWLDAFAAVDQMTWAPGEPAIITGRLFTEGGWVENPTSRSFNRYRPPTIRGGDPTKAGRWVEHIRRLYPDEADHILDWCAQRVQNPGTKLNHALLLGGRQGIGKDTILYPLRMAVGPSNFAVVNPPDVVKEFNEFVRSVIVLIPELYDLGETNKYSFYEHVKTLIAAPPTMLRLNEKFLRATPIPNVVGVIFTSNQRTGIYLPPGDRRHFAAWSEVSFETHPQTFPPNPATYFAGLYHWFERECGNAHVAAFLHARDLSAFNPAASPRQTAWHRHIVETARAPEDAEMADALDHLGGPPGGEETWPDAVTVNDVVAGAQTGGNGDFVDWLRERKNRRGIGRRLEAVGYVAVANPTATTTDLWRVGGTRMMVYARERLDPAARYAAVLARVERGRS